MKQLLIFTMAILISSISLYAQKAGRVDTMQHAIFYACPMHPAVTSHAAGKCPSCGMALTLSGKEKMKADLSNNYVCPVHLKVTSHDPGKCPQCGKKMNLSIKEQMKAEVTKRYTCPMHPQVALDKDGVCPDCGTALILKKNK